jgi:hypothetical protein
VRHAVDCGGIVVPMADYFWLIKASTHIHEGLNPHPTVRLDRYLFAIHIPSNRMVQDAGRQGSAG